MALTGWQQEILVKLQERDAAERSNAGIIESYKRLSAQTAILKERNRSLLKAAATSRTGSNGAFTNGGDDNPVRQAYVTSLESQLGSLRDELSTLYKTQAQNAQRLVHLTEQLQSNNEQSSSERSELQQLRNERSTREREREEALHLRKEKDRNIELLQDELGMLKLEFEMLEKRNDALKEDNSSLLRRWLEKKAQEAAEMDKMLESNAKGREAEAKA